MAQAKHREILAATTGLNNFVDPTRLKFDFKTGVTELSQAVNVNIDNTGRPSRRLGRTQKSATASSYGFAHGDVCLFVSGTTLYQMKDDYSIVALRSDLTANARMRYYPIAGRIYYINGAEKGYVFDGKDYAWEKGNYTSQAPTNRIFSNPPNGHLAGWFSGRALIARGNVVFGSEPSFYGVFDLHNNFRMMPKHITMLRPTTQGLWVGTTDQVLFYRGSKWKELRREPKAGYGVLEGSDALCPGEKLKMPEQPIIFTTPQGVCIGGDDGSFDNVSYNKFTFPTGRYASATVAGDRYIVLVEP